MSHSELFLNSILSEDKAGSQENLELLQSEYPLERALSIQWCAKSDTYFLQILQDICRENYNWDTEVRDGIKECWKTWTRDAQKLNQFSVQRCIKPKDFGEVTSVELHHFSGASSVGYGVCLYIRLTNEHNQVHASFLLGKSRVIPPKHMTIPRLEL